jgi:hypothetical protein
VTGTTTNEVLINLASYTATNEVLINLASYTTTNEVLINLASYTATNEGPARALANHGETATREEEVMNTKPGGAAGPGPRLMCSCRRSARHRLRPSNLRAYACKREH